MAIPLHSHFGWTARAREQIDVIADRYRSIGDDPRVLAICWAIARPRYGNPFSTPLLNFYCYPQSEGLPTEEIGTIDGIECVFFLVEKNKPLFWGKVLDWAEPGRWVLLDASPGT